MHKLRVHTFLPMTLANGPGRRCCLWLQGCTLACPGCFNPETHAQTTEKSVDVMEVFNLISQSKDIEGLTVSGGEPLQQPEALIQLLQLVRQETHLSCVLFTGFRFEEVQSMPLFSKLKQVVDVLVAGRYVADKRIKSGILGSTNKTFHYFSSRYELRDMEDVPVSEVIIDRHGTLAITGVEPPNLRNE